MKTQESIIIWRYFRWISLWTIQSHVGMKFIAILHCQLSIDHTHLLICRVLRHWNAKNSQPFSPHVVCDRHRIKGTYKKSHKQEKNFYDNSWLTLSLSVYRCTARQWVCRLISYFTMNWIVVKFKFYWYDYENIKRQINKHESRRVRTKELFLIMLRYEKKQKVPEVVGGRISWGY